MMAQRLLLRHGLVGRLRLYSSCLYRTSPNYASTSCTSARWYGSTRVLRQESKQEESKQEEPKQESVTDEAKKEESQDNDDCPPWQNPLHHNNPDYQPTKVFEEDFAPGEEIPKIPLPPLDDGSGKVQAPPHLHELADEVVNLTMLEMNDLVNKIGDHFGFDDSVQDDMMGGGGAAEGSGEGAEEEKEEAKTAFDLKLTGFDAKAKIKVIKEVRAMAGLGLKEAKELVEGAPAVVKKEIKMEEAEELKKKLEDIGGTVEIV